MDDGWMMDDDDGLSHPRMLLNCYLYTTADTVGSCNCLFDSTVLMLD